MSERVAWLQLARWAILAKRKQGPMRDSGLCFSLWKLGLRKRQRDRMSLAIAKEGGIRTGIYHWSLTPDGYQCRANFCRAQAARLRASSTQGKESE